MTEPIDEREPARPAVPWPYAPEPPPGGADGENRPVQPEPPIPGWVPPDASAPGPEAGSWVVPPAETGSGQARGCLRGCVIVGAILAILAVVLLVAFIFLGSQVQSALKGTVEFGTGGEACSVSGGATSFKAGTELHFVALLERSVSAGETLTVVQTFPDARTDTDRPEGRKCRLVHVRRPPRGRVRRPLRDGGPYRVGGPREGRIRGHALIARW